MPIYEYECQNCGIKFERKQSIHEDPVKECPECKGQTRRVLYPVGIIFKGSGFYITDSRKSDTAAVGAKDASSDAKGDSSNGSEKSEAKQEAKASGEKAGVGTAKQ